MSPARACAYTVLRRVFERGAYADRALRSEAARLDSRDRALAMRLAYGAVQRRGTLDHLIERLAERDTSRLQAQVLAALRLGLYELLYLDGSPDHAVVSDAVQLSKSGGGAGHGLVNAVLRRAAREGRAQLLGALDDKTPERAAIKHSHPVWIAQMWWRELGAPVARALMAHDNEPAEVALRANTLLTDASGLLAQLPVKARIDQLVPEAVVLEEPFDAYASSLWRDGAFVAQSRAAMLAARVLGPLPGERVLDLCAAPGAKSTHLAALMEGRGEVLAVERNAQRAEALVATAKRCRADNVRVAARRRRARSKRMHRALTVCSSIRPARGWARCSPTPTCAGASPPRARSRWRARRLRSCALERAPYVREACLSTLRARSPRLRTSASSPHSSSPMPTSPSTISPSSCRRWRFRHGRERWAPGPC